MNKFCRNVDINRNVNKNFQTIYANRSLSQTKITVAFY